MRLRTLILLDVLLFVASFPGLLNVVAKDRATTTEGIIAWVSFAALLVSILGLLALLGIGLRRRLAGRS